MRTRMFPLLGAPTLMAFVLLLIPLGAWAAPPAPTDATFAAVQADIRAGNTASADRTLAQFLAAHPNSAQAHYVESRLLAAEGKWPLARAELNRATQLAPDMPFVSADALQALRTRIDAHLQEQSSRSMSPGLMLLAAAFLSIFAYLLFGMFRARKRPAQ